MEDIWENYIYEHNKTISEIQKNFDTVVINAFAGAGAGKTTACLEISEKLKKSGYVVEYVQEYAKDLVWEENWEMLDGTEAHQFQILQEQINRVDRLIGKTQFIVTDSPILLNGIYNKELTAEYTDMLSELYSQYNNFNFYVERDINNYETDGRLQTLEESIAKDQEVIDMLDDFQLYFGRYNHDTVDKIVNNAIKTYSKRNNEQYRYVNQKNNMKIGTKVRLHEHGNIKGYATIIIDDAIAINNFRIMQTEKGHLFVTMPQRKNADGEYVDIANPITKDAGNKLIKRF